MRTIVLFLFFLALIFSVANDEIGNGNIKNVQINSSGFSTWYGVCGQSSSAPTITTKLNATPGNSSCYTFMMGTDSCTYGVIDTVYLLFSNSSDSIVSLSPGNITKLDYFINRIGANATATFKNTTSFNIQGYGSIKSVPLVYTNSQPPNTFPMGYMQDQNGNIVLATPILNDQKGFNGSLFDFQLMLPTMDGNSTTYYITVAKSCILSPYQPPASGGGGGTHTPFYNTNHTSISCTCGELSSEGKCINYQCCSNEVCTAKEYCDISNGKKGGICKSIHGCGTIVNHTLIPYECGNTTLCPICPTNYQCINNKCMLYLIKAKNETVVGEPVNIKVTENGLPCVFCVLTVYYQDGSLFSLKVNKDGVLAIIFTKAGTYLFTLLKDEKVVSSLQINILQKTVPNKELTLESQQEPMPSDVLSIIFFIIFFVIILYIIRKLIKYLLNNKKKKDDHNEKK